MVIYRDWLITVIIDYPGNLVYSAQAEENQVA
ncbi:hypothetical protein predicted by Glimmer/Critica [Lactiplantibacillus plantarum]|nr:hypothetical protein predicted by Glimmer/Critica [Lactiplantibacillus plantarum]